MFLLDTNVLSEARRPKGDRGVKRWIDEVPGADLYLSVLVIGEIRQGIERLRRRDAPAAAPYDQWLEQLVSEHSERLLPVTIEVAQAWGRLNVPDPLPTIDGLLAATAKVYGLIVATRNVEDFRRAGVRVHNPFSAGSSP